MSVTERPTLRSVLVPIVQKFQDTTTLSQALAKTGDYMVSHAQGNAAVKTGYMKSQIGYDKDGQLKIVFYAGAYYSIFVEKGHRTRGGGFVSPRPFMEPAALAGEQFLRAEIDKIIQNLRR